MTALGSERDASSGASRDIITWDASVADALVTTELERAAAFYGADGEGATAMLPILHAMQAQFGCVPDHAVPLIADRLNVSRADVRGVISFYHDFDTEPITTPVLQLCRAEACQARGADRLAAYAASVNPHGSARPLTLKNVYCLGNCALGPSAMIGDALLSGVTEAVIDDILRRSANGTA